MPHKASAQILGTCHGELTLGSRLISRSALQDTAAGIHAKLQTKAMDVFTKSCTTGWEKARVPHQLARGVSVVGIPTAVYRQVIIAGFVEPQVDQALSVVLDDGLIRITVVVVIRIPSQHRRRSTHSRGGDKGACQEQTEEDSRRHVDSSDRQQALGSGELRSSGCCLSSHIAHVHARRLENIYARVFIYSAGKSAGLTSHGPILPGTLP